MTLQEALAIVMRKARYAFQAQFTSVMTQQDAQAIVVENSRLENVADENGVYVETTVYDITQAAIQILETVAPFAPQSKSIGGISVTYEVIQQAIDRLKSSQVNVRQLGRYPQETGPEGMDEE